MTVTVTIEVTDNGDGTLSTTVSYSDDKEFNNIYEATGTAENIAVSKVLTGRSLADGQFEFVITEDGGTYTETVTNDANGNVNFADISYNQDQIGTHTYSIVETNAGASGYTYDGMTVTVTIEVTDNGDGTLSTTVTYSDDTEFNNVYEATGTADEIAVTKVLTGKDLSDGQFEFVLTETTDDLAEAPYTETVTNDADGNVNFSSISYDQDQVGTHTYSIVETNLEEAGYTYDDMTVTVTVEVIDNGDGTLSAEVTYSEDTEFNNVYETIEITNDARGNVNFTDIIYDQDQIGTHTYSITETDAKAKGYTYDDMTVTVTIEVTDNGDGTLSASVNYSDDKEFNNTYEANGLLLQEQKHLQV